VVTVKTTLYNPGSPKKCVGETLVLEPPSSKFHIVETTESLLSVKFLNVTNPVSQNSFLSLPKRGIAP
jgi:hypothetical protein